MYVCISVWSVGACGGQRAFNPCESLAVSAAEELRPSVGVVHTLTTEHLSFRKADRRGQTEL